MAQYLVELGSPSIAIT